MMLATHLAMMMDNSVLEIIPRNWPEPDLLIRLTIGKPPCVVLFSIFAASLASITIAITTTGLIRKDIHLKDKAFLVILNNN